MSEPRRYYALDDAGRIVSWRRSTLDLAEFVQAMRNRGDRHEWTANPTAEQLAELDARESADALGVPS